MRNFYDECIEEERKKIKEVQKLLWNDPIAKKSMEKYEEEYTKWAINTTRIRKSSGWLCLIVFPVFLLTGLFHANFGIPFVLVIVSAFVYGWSSTSEFVYSEKNFDYVNDCLWELGDKEKCDFLYKDHKIFIYKNGELQLLEDEVGEKPSEVYKVSFWEVDERNVSQCTGYVFAETEK